MDYEYSNNFLMAVELCLNQNNQLEDQILLSLANLEKIHTGLEVDKDENSFKFSVTDTVDRDNNVIVDMVLKFLTDNRAAFIKSVEQGGEVVFAIYIWSLKASDTPQIDFNTEQMKLMGDIGVNLSFVVYT